MAKSSFSAVEQQVVYLAVSVFHECEYCTAGHTYLARSSGMAEDVLQALRGGAVIADPRLQALRAFTERVLHQRGFAGDEAVDTFFAAGFTNAQVLEVVTVIATKTISNYVNHLAHTPKESFMADPALAWVAQAPKEALPYGGAMLSPRLRPVAALLMAIVALASCGGYVLALDSLLEL